MYERRSHINLNITCHEYLHHGAWERSCNRHLHLHGLDEGELIACIDVIARSDGHGNHHSRSRTADKASFLVCDTMRDTLDLYIALWSIYERKDTISSSETGKPPFNSPQSLYLYLNALSAHGHAILLGTEAGDLEFID
jgi:hypothetical protein